MIYIKIEFSLIKLRQLLTNCIFSSLIHNLISNFITNSIWMRKLHCSHFQFQTRPQYLLFLSHLAHILSTLGQKLWRKLPLSIEVNTFY